MILDKDNKPFSSKSQAKFEARTRQLTEYSIVPHQDGYAILEDTEVPEEKKETEQIMPLKKKHAVTEPWKPATLLGIPKHLQDPRFVYRFCKKDRPGNIQKKIAEGWEIDKELSKKMAPIPTIQDGASLDSTLQVREMVVMRMPVEMAESRKKYYADRSKNTIRDAQKKFKQDVGQIAESYGTIEETRVLQEG